MTTETMNFNADVARLLDIVAHALYSHQDVFLRELISNASDACDRLRYEAIGKPELTKDNPNFRIHIQPNAKARTLTVTDNGIGMNKEELVENLGTIAKSGTATLMEQIKNAPPHTPPQAGGKKAAKRTSGGEEDPLKLIGQFGVGFYASYMVAGRVKVISRKAGQKDIWVWESDGRTGFDVSKAGKDDAALLDGERGTAIILSIKDDASDFLLEEKLKQTVQQYSDHIDVKIFLNSPADTAKGEGQPVNQAAALWAKPKNEITEEQYTNFYRHLTHGFDEPLSTIHWKAEGKIEFNALLYIPTLRPWDLYDPGRKQAVRLYVRRVFISDALDGLVYPWMRFLRGVVDSEDLPLNISRESLQHNPLLAKIRSAITKRVLSELDKLSKSDPAAFLTFWGQFGPALKEGLYDAFEHRDDIFKICRFYSTHDNGDKFTTLDEYVARMGDDQNEIYYITGENLQGLKNSPQIEGFKERGLEVLFLTDTIDDFWLQQVPEYKGKIFKSVTRGDIDLGKAEDKPEDTPENNSDLMTALKELLADEVADVRPSKRLTSSPVCLVAPDDGVDMHMERILKLHQDYKGASKPVLEINTGHALIKKLQAIKDAGGLLDDAAFLLLDQAQIIQGNPLKDPAAFARRMSAVMEKGL